MALNDPSFRDFVEQVKAAVRIEEIVRDHVPTLIHSGSSFKGCCPFHKEKTPSFYVHPDMGFYHCFGCGQHGDAIKFVQEIEKIDFKLALEQLARRAGLTMPVFRGGPDKSDEEQRRLDRLRELCIWAGEFFIEQMRVHPRGALARDYLRNRGLSDEEIKGYKLGYAPEGWEVLLHAAEKRGWSAETVVEAGLASRRDNGGFTDRFRDRVMFPIEDRLGQLVAFAGRLIEDREGAPKYINSAETPLFKKNQVLYGLSATREGIKQAGSVVLLEGYMDWIAMDRHGIKNALAGMGTALTEEQARLLRRLASKVILLYDADAAGQKAMFRATEILLRQGMAVHAAVLQGDHDPDTFLAAEGAQAMRDLLAAAPPAIDHFIRVAAQENDIGRPEGKAAAVERIAPLLLAIEEPTLREGYIQRGAASFGLQSATMEASLKKRRGRVRPPESALDGPPLAEPPVEEWEPSQTEQNLLYILLQRPDRWESFQATDPEWIQHPELYRLYERIYGYLKDLREGAEPFDDLFALAEDETMRHWLSRILLLPVRRFGGEVGAFEKGLGEAYGLQVLKLEKMAAQRRKQRLAQDMQLILADNPAGAGQLAAIDALTRGTVERWDRFLGTPEP